MNFLLLITFEIAIGVYFFFNIILVTFYFFSNFYKNFKKILVYWIDLWILKLFNLCLILSILISLSKSNDMIKADLSKIIKSFVEFFYMGVILLSTQNLIQNLVKSFYFVIRKKKILVEKENKIFNKKFHFIILIIQWISNIIFMLAYYKYQISDILENEEKSSIYIIEIFFLILTVFSISIIFILNWEKVKIEKSNKTQRCNDNQEDSLNIKLQENVKLRIDFLIYKTILDIVLNIPILLILSIRKITTLIVILHQFILLIYSIFQANLQFKIDKLSFRIQDSYKFFFCSRHFRLKLGNPISSSRRNSGFRDSKIHFNLQEENSVTYSESGIDLDSFLISSSQLDINEPEKYDDNLHSNNEYLPINFFIVFKLMWNYFKINEKIFINLERRVKDMEENHKINSEQFKKSFVSKFSDSENLTNGIKNILADVNFISCLNLKMFEVFNSIEDIDIKDQFQKILDNTLKLNTSKLNFQIESLFEENLKELIPFYQICCKDILNSIDSEKNKAICKILFEKKYSDNSFNNFFTFDTFLSFEIYDKDETLGVLKNFIPSYSKYIMSKIKNWDQTFLPMIISVFNIKYLNYDKLIILSRHPLAFSPFVAFKFWMNICLLENEEKISFSSNYTEVIDMKEIEIKDNILMHKDDHTELIKTLKEDFKFLKNLNFCSEYNLNIFIINDLKNFLSTFGVKRKTVTNQFEVTIDNFGTKDNPYEMRDSNLQNHDESNRNENLNDWNELNDTDNAKSNFLPNDLFSVFRRTKNTFTLASAKNNNSTKQNGSDVVCLMEKILTNYVMNNRYLIKIYFSGILRNNVTQNFKRHFNNGHKIYNKLHSGILKKQVFRILKSQDEFEEIKSESEGKFENIDIEKEIKN